MLIEGHSGQFTEAIEKEMEKRSDKSFDEIINPGKDISESDIDIDSIDLDVNAEVPSAPAVAAKEPRDASDVRVPAE